MDLLASCCSGELRDHCTCKVRGEKSSEGAEELVTDGTVLGKEPRKKALHPMGRVQERR